MVSRDFIKYNKKNLYPSKEEIATNPDSLNNWIKTGKGKNKRRKVVVVGKEGMKRIREKEIEEMYPRIHLWKYKNQVKFIKEHIPVADRKMKRELITEWSSGDLAKLIKIFKNNSKKCKNLHILSYLENLFLKRLKEELALNHQKSRQKKEIEKTGGMDTSTF